MFKTNSKFLFFVNDIAMQRYFQEPDKIVFLRPFASINFHPYYKNIIFYWLLAASQIRATQSFNFSVIIAHP